jgi:hypothetical protein
MNYNKLIFYLIIISNLNFIFKKKNLYLFKIKII